jgi:hypothetical protein
MQNYENRISAEFPGDSGPLPDLGRSCRKNPVVLNMADRQKFLGQKALKLCPVLGNQVDSRLLL